MEKPLFYMANFWLFVTLMLIVGRTPERYSPTRYSCFGYGYFNPFAYGLLVVIVLSVSLIMLNWARSKKVT